LSKILFKDSISAIKWQISEYKKTIEKPKNLIFEALTLAEKDFAQGHFC